MKDDSNDVQAIIDVFGCTGSTETCPVHSENRPKWFYLGTEGDIGELINACNPRGFREIDLADALTSFKTWLEPAVDNLAAVLKEGAEAIKDDPMNGIQDIATDVEMKETSEPLTNGHSEDIPMENGLDKSEPDVEVKTKSKSRTPDSMSSSARKKKGKETFATAAEFMGLKEIAIAKEEFQGNPLSNGLRNLMAEFVSRINLQALGELFFNEGQTQEQFLHALQEGEDIKPFMTDDDLKIHLYDVENILNREVFDELPNNDVNQIMLAFIKIIHGIRLKYLKEPFVIFEKKRNVTTSLPAKTFVTWQSAIPESQSLSALALFATEFETNVQWNAFKNAVGYFFFQGSFSVNFF